MASACSPIGSRVLDLQLVNPRFQTRTCWGSTRERLPVGGRMAAAVSSHRRSSSVKRTRCQMHTLAAQSDGQSAFVGTWAVFADPCSTLGSTSPADAQTSSNVSVEGIERNTLETLARAALTLQAVWGVTVQTRVRRLSICLINYGRQAVKAVPPHAVQG